MALSTRHRRQNPSMLQPESKKSTKTAQATKLSSSLADNLCRLRMGLRQFNFESLPFEVRSRIYYFLGFPAEAGFTLFTDRNQKFKTSLRGLYKVDLTAEGELSVPWNYQRNHRPKQATETAAINFMCTNSILRNELYPLLYANSLFVVHTWSHKKPKIPTLSELARNYISHLVISFNAVETTKEIFNAKSYPQALISIIATAAPLVPNLRYFGINLWTVHFPRIFPTSGDPTPGVDHSGLREKKGDHSDFSDTSFLGRTLLDFIRTHPAVESFTLLRNMQPRGQLDWNRNKDNVRKALARDLKKCMSKVYES